MEKLKRLSDFEIHSIEQPIRQGQISEMAHLCLKTPLPIALDEELIGVFNVTKKKELLQIINPQYIILKPSLVGGFKASEDWINLAEKQKLNRNPGFLSMLETDAILQRMEKVEQNIETKTR